MSCSLARVPWKGLALASVLLLIISGSPLVAFVHAYTPPSRAALLKANQHVWADKKFDVKVMFNTIPANPDPNAPSTLVFRVLHMSTGQPFTRYNAHVVVMEPTGGYYNYSAPGAALNGGGYFKFPPVAVDNSTGSFLENYYFPWWGGYKVFATISTPNFIVPANFIFNDVKPAAPAYLNYVYLIVPAVAGIAAVGGFFAMRRPSKSPQ